MPDWKAFEGRLLDGKYPLERCVAGDEDAALFLSGPFAVRIRRAAPPEAAEIVGRWNRVKRFPHSHLIAIEAAGAAGLEGDPVAYLVMERAEETLADVLRARPLAPEEARAMLLPVAAALDYLHRRGMAHGAVKPAHIFAIGDTVKLSSESVAEGDSAADIRALGQTVIETLSPSGAASVDPAALPSPFDSIALGCLHPDPKRCWTADRIVSRLRIAERASSPPSTLRRLAVPGVVGAVAIGIVGGVMLRRFDAPPSAPAAVAPINPEPTPAPLAAPLPPPPASTPKTPPAARDSSRDRLMMEDGVARRVLPNVPQKARNTITGKPAVVVRVTVDPAGNVTDAVVERSFSPYFAKFALEAARKWQFAPEDRAAPRRWTLRFVFTRTATNAVARPVR